MNRAGCTIVAAVLLIELLAACTNELAPTQRLAVQMAKAADWPDTLSVAEIASVGVSLTAPGHSAVTGVALHWSSTDSSVLSIAGEVSSATATAADRLAASLRAVVIARAAGRATIIARITQPGLVPETLSVPAIVTNATRDSVPSEMTVTSVVTIGLKVQRANTGVTRDAAVTWTSNDPSTLRVDTIPGDRFRARITAKTSGSAQVSASVTSGQGRWTFQLPIRIGTRWSAVTAGWHHTCAINAANRLGYCWGSNVYGELGNGSLNQARLPARVASALQFDELSAGGDTNCLNSCGNRSYEAHTCGRAGNSVLCWGAPVNGQIGDGIVRCSPIVDACADATPVMVIINGQTITNRATRSVDQAFVDGIAAGGRHTCAHYNQPFLGTQVPSLRCWGYTANDVMTFASGHRLPFALDSASTGFGGNAALNAPIVVYGPPSTGTGTVFMLGGDFVCAMSSANPVAVIPPSSTTCAAGSQSFISVGDLKDRNTRDVFPWPASAGRDHACGLVNGAALCWGSNAVGQLGAPTNTVCAGVACSRVAIPVLGLPVGGATAIAAGHSHSCTLQTSNEVWCWGSNSDGQLGNGGRGGSSATPTKVAGGYRFASIGAGGRHTCGITIDGSLYCWGRNGDGQLGNETTTSSATPVRVGEPP